MRQVSRRLFLKVATGMAAAAGASSLVACGGAPDEASAENGLPPNTAAAADSVATDQPFDFIVVGSGAGGGPLAANLAFAGFRVLVLEAGVDLGNQLIYRVPLLHAVASEFPAMAWNYFVDHYDNPADQAKDSKLTPQGILYPRGGTVGGSTAQNAMITVRPHARDWDAMAAALDDTQWSSATMDRYFTLLESCEYLVSGAPLEGHGTGGWLRTSMASARTNLADPNLLRIVAGADAVLEKSERPLGEALGDVQYRNDLVRRLRRDLNRMTPDRDGDEGVFGVPMAVSGGLRNGPRDYLMRAQAMSKNLVIKTQALVTRVLFEKLGEELKAVGVEYLDGPQQYKAGPVVGPLGKKVQVKAQREVILAGGVFNTPQLLMLSGIGPREELERPALNVPVLVDLPGVGKNLQDRYEVSVVTEVARPFLATMACTFDPSGSASDPCANQLMSGSGPYADNGVICGVVKRSNHANTPDPDLFLFGVPADFRGYKPGYSAGIPGDRKHFSWAVLKAHTANKTGSVTLTSSDPRDVPHVAFRYFPGGKEDTDLAAVVDGVELAREMIRATASVPGMVLQEVFPGPAVTTRDQIAEFVRSEAWGHHACGTCKMGPSKDPQAVVDGQFRVHGVAGLRVVDASIFPDAPGFFIATAVYMVSEKATDDVLEAHGRPRRVS